MSDTGSTRDGFGEDDLAAVEASHPNGMTVQQIVEAFAARGQKLTEATFRKYVQLGLLPRSVRVARKGKRRGSQGMYPATAVRQIEQIRQLMGQGYTMEEIQREFLFIRGDIEELTRQLERIYASIERVIAEREPDAVDAFLERELGELKATGADLQERKSFEEREAEITVPEEQPQKTELRVTGAGQEDILTQEEIAEIVTIVIKILERLNPSGGER